MLLKEKATKKATLNTKKATPNNTIPMQPRGPNGQ
jgi:hypothetical protein